MSLIYNGVTITTWVNLVSDSGSRPAVKPIAWPNAAGNDALWTGDAAGGGRVLEFGDQPPYLNRLVAYDEATVVAAREVLMAWARVPFFATLVFDGQTFGRMMLVRVQAGGIVRTVSPTTWQIPFSAAWKQFPG